MASAVNGPFTQSIGMITKLWENDFDLEFCQVEIHQEKLMDRVLDMVSEHKVKDSVKAKDSVKIKKFLPSKIKSVLISFYCIAIRIVINRKKNTFYEHYKSTLSFF